MMSPAELAEYERFCNVNLRRNLIEALDLGTGDLGKKVSVLERGAKLIAFLQSKKEELKQINAL